jgi:predicted N-acetyltransferase YhbS
MSIVLRPPRAEDAEACGRILYAAFFDIATKHAFPPDFPSVDMATQLAGMLIQANGVFGVVAEKDGQVAGSNFMSESDPIRGVGPISVDPTVQGSGIGRLLMKAVIERGSPARGIRLVQDAFNTRSMSLYASLGFEVKEPLAMIQGRPATAGAISAQHVVRPMEPGDVSGCVELCRRVHGVDRTSELKHSGPLSSPWVAVRDGRITGYATAPAFWAVNHAAAESDEDMRALFQGFSAVREEPLWFLLPIREAAFFRWCLAERLRVIKPMTLMTIGEYRAPEGACWLPSVAY